jgi:dephospho-CoA kinase
VAAGQRKIVIGLAGGIGAGKSTVARILADLGARVIESDCLNREELNTPEVIETLVAWFGESIRSPDGGIMPQAVADIIFRDPGQRARLEGLLHPRIERRRNQLIDRARRDPDTRAIVLDSPLLFEAGLDRICDVVIFVDAPADQCRRRVAETRGWTQDELTRREKSQRPLDIKKTQADHIVINDSGLGDLRIKVEKLLSELLAHASR